MQRAHVIRLYSTPTQENYFLRACGCVRVAYNWGIDEAKRMYEAGEEFSHYGIKKRFNAIKEEQYPFMSEVTKWGPERAFENLNKAYKGLFTKKTEYPKYKKRGVRDSFYTSGSVLQFQGSRIRLPKIGWIRMAEELRFSGKVISATVRPKAGNWYVSIAVELEDSIPPIRETQAVGVDLGIKHLAVLSTGEKLEGPKALAEKLRELKRLSKVLSRRQKGGYRWKATKLKLARCHFRIRNIRNDYLHKLTTRLVNDYSVIAIEDLNVKGMIRNRHLSRRIADASFGEFRRQLEYKAVPAGTKVVVAGRFFPSSKLCNNCGHKLETLDLSTRLWVCPGCGSHHDRDVNAAMNLAGLAAG